MPLRALIAVELLVIAVAGAATVVRFPVWALVDERAHYDYVQTVATEGRLPWLGRDLISDEAEAIDEGVYPRARRVDPATRGLAGQSYEAFQPPLYYVAAAPVFLAGGDHLAKLRALRALGLVLLMASAGLLWLLARRALGRAAGAGFALALTALAWPGVVVRTVTVSNAALELPLDLGALLLLWDAHERRDGRRLALAGLVVGLALLTRLSSVVLVPVLAGVAVGFLRGGGSRRTVALALVLPLLALAPWVASNLDRYGAPTAGAVVRAMQEPVLNSAGRDYGAADLPRLHDRLLNGVLAEEWWSQFLSPVKRRLRDIFVALAFLVPPLLAAVRRPRGGARALALLAAPLALALALMTAGLLIGNWDFFYPRYLYGVLPAYGLFAALALGPRASARAAGVLTLGLAGLWAYLATVTPFVP
jgi:4-amino-4-deoxy-L-arabinose transferase-like glycosyltransferase